MLHRDADTLTSGLDDIRSSPPDGGRLDLLVRRPAIDEREILTAAELSPVDGLVGDTWNVRPSRRTDHGGPHPDMQLNVINARFSSLISSDDDHRSLAGDQLHVDLDLSEANLPAGTRLAIGTAVIEVTEQPHTGCVKFSARFGADARRLVNSDAGRELRLRGINAKVVQAGTILVGDAITKAV